MKNILFYLLAVTIACENVPKNKDVPPIDIPPIDIPEPESPEYEIGYNRFTTSVDGVTREYYVHVPKDYSDEGEHPVVFMLHGGGSNGKAMYEGSGWKEVGDKENILTVFPSAWEYCINDPEDGKITKTKWNILPEAEWTFCNEGDGKDDIKFLNKVIEDLQSKFSISNKSIYVVGFSNGGQMATACALVMGDKLAAVVENAGSYYKDITYMPIRKLPITYQVGNDDWGPGAPDQKNIPLNQLEYLLTTPDLPFPEARYYTISQSHIRNFGLNPNFEGGIQYTINSDNDTTIAVANYYLLEPERSENPDMIFRVVMVKGLKHKYPNGKGHWMKAAEEHWAWMKKYALPD